LAGKRGAFLEWVRGKNVTSSISMLVLPHSLRDGAFILLPQVALQRVGVELPQAPGPGASGDGRQPDMALVNCSPSISLTSMMAVTVAS
jgi:hypothetical protein